MKPLKDLLLNLEISQLIGSDEVEIAALAFDSRRVEAKTAFIAQKGLKADGHNYIETAIEKGATVIVCEDLPEEILPQITYIQCPDTAKALGIMASNFYNQPSRKLKLIGITGTNGKTTTATLLYQLFENLGHSSGLISTIKNYIGKEALESSHTTPNALELNQLLNVMVEKGCEYCFMEVSSHGISQERIAGLTFAGGVFTNLTHDHLDFHKTFEAYRDVKKSFFDRLPKNAFALSNIDDKNGLVMLQNTKAAIYTYSLQRGADFKAKILENSIEGLNMELNGYPVWLRLCGRFNAYNLLAIYAVAVLLKQNEEEVLRILSALSPVEGRFQYYMNDRGSIGIVDYAHTPDALENVLKTLTDIVREDTEIITVVGCGGDRDVSKRPLMAKIACRYSDKVILTSDNPRSENPYSILEAMKQGVTPENDRKVLTIENRREAIKTACSLLKPGSALLVAGKGHETYQEIEGVRSHFDDKEEIIKYL